MLLALFCFLYLFFILFVCFTFLKSSGVGHARDSAQWQRCYIVIGGVNRGTIPFCSVGHILVILIFIVVSIASLVLVINAVARLVEVRVEIVKPRHLSL